MNINGILLRYSEIFLKKGRRDFFINVLKKNVEEKIRRFSDIKITSPHGYLLVLPGKEKFIEEERINELINELKKIFGIVSISPILISTNDVEEISKFAIKIAMERKDKGANSFKINASRAFKEYKYNSIELNRIVGEKVRSATKLKVDLQNPDFTINLYITMRDSLLWTDVIECYGGLPVGSSGNALLMLSGGIDSPVAGFLTMKRGCNIDALYFHSFPYTKEGAKEKVIKLCEILVRYQKKMRLFIVPFSAIQNRFRESAPSKNLVLLYRRAMMRIGEIIAKKYNYLALVTGENIGQVASQTLQNLACIEDVAQQILVLRPLLTYDKAETMALAKKIGTYEISILPYEDCCLVFVPKHPEVEGDIEELKTIEEKIPLQSLIEISLNQMEIMEF